MKKILAPVAALLFTSCQTVPNNPKVASYDQALQPYKIYSADLSWGEIKSQLRKENSKASCVYHLIDFDLSDDGKVRNPRISDASDRALKSIV